METTGSYDSLASKPLPSLLKRGPKTRATGTTQELVRNAEFQAPNQLNQNLHFNKVFLRDNEHSTPSLRASEWDLPTFAVGISPPCSKAVNEPPALKRILG